MGGGWLAKQLIHIYIYIYISLNRFQNKSFALWEFSFFRQNIGCLCFFSISHTLPGVTSMPVSVVPNTTGRERSHHVYTVCRQWCMCVGKRMLERERGDKYNDECPVALT